MSEVDYKIKYLKYKKKYLELKEQAGGNKIITVFEHQFPADLKAFAVQKDWVEDYVDLGIIKSKYNYTPVILSNFKLKLSFNAKFLTSFTAGLVADDNFILELTLDNSVNKDQKGGKIPVEKDSIEMNSLYMKIFEKDTIGSNDDEMLDYIRLFNWAGYKTPMNLKFIGGFDHPIESINNSLESKVHLDEFNKLSDNQKNIVKNNMLIIKFKIDSGKKSNIKSEDNKNVLTPEYIICGLTKDPFKSKEDFEEIKSRVTVRSLVEAADKGFKLGQDEEYALVEAIRGILSDFQYMNKLQDPPKEVGKFEFVKKKSARKVIHRK